VPQCDLCGAEFEEGVQVTAIHYSERFEHLLPVTQGPLSCSTEHAVRAFGDMPKIITTVPFPRPDRF
jgi:hypothetical protein